MILAYAPFYLFLFGPYVLGAMLALVLTIRWAPKKMSLIHSLSLLPLYLCLLEAMWGAYCWPEHRLLTHGGYPWQARLLDYVQYAYIAVSVGLVASFKGHRLFFTAAFFCGFLYLTGCRYIAYQAITDLWM
jgi:hypothetical protein